MRIAGKVACLKQSLKWFVVQHFRNVSIVWSVKPIGKDFKHGCFNVMPHAQKQYSG